MYYKLLIKIKSINLSGNFSLWSPLEPFLTVTWNWEELVPASIWSKQTNKHPFSRYIIWLKKLWHTLSCFLCFWLFSAHILKNDWCSVRKQASWIDNEGTWTTGWILFCLCFISNVYCALCMCTYIPKLIKRFNFLFYI